MFARSAATAYLATMNALPEIQAAIEKLPRKEFWKLAKWIDGRKEIVWDAEIDEDFRPGGPLDWLAQEAVEEHKAGLTRPIEELLRFHSKRPPGRRARFRRK